MRASLLAAAFLLAAVLMGACGGGNGSSITVVPGDSPTPNGDPTSPASPGDTPTVAENGDTPDPSDPTATPGDIVMLPCGDLLAPVDKRHQLPADCRPDDLVALPLAYAMNGDQYMRTEAADALMDMLDGARVDGFEMFALSSFRSYETQAATFQGHVDRIGREEALRQSAPPGHSEHQLGTTTDLTSASANFTLDDFTGTPEADWVAENAWRYGFIVSYPPGTEHITGYIHEPWHIRYVGVDVAQEVQESGLTLGVFLQQRQGGQ